MSRHEIASPWPCGWRALATIVAMMVLGCGRHVDDGRVPVSGSVVFNGQPVSHGTVLFATPSGKGDSSAQIDPNGRFQLRLLPEEYTVVVRSTEGEDHLDQQGRFIAAKKLVPARYFDCRTSDLRITVQPGMAPVALSIGP